MHVSLETAILIGSEGTQSAYIGLLSRVGPHVLGQIVMKTSSIVTKWTLVNLPEAALLAAPGTEAERWSLSHASCHPPTLTFRPHL